MEFLEDFIHSYLHYCQEIWLILGVGFLLSGLVYKFVPSELVERHLGEKGLRPILYASFVGALLPVCCMGSLPIAITLRRKGATLGAIMAFLVATPATSISALIVCWKLLGAMITIYIFFAVILMGVITGAVMNKLDIPPPLNADTKASNCCSSSGQVKTGVFPTLSQRIWEALRYAFVTLPKEIGLEILIGIGVASFITASDPIRHFISEYLVGHVGYLVILIVGLLTYVCSTASVPMADALVQSGMSYGQALCYLIAGPITSYGTILVIKKDFGVRVLGIYLAIISTGALASGLLYDYFVQPLK